MKLSAFSAMRACGGMLAPVRTLNPTSTALAVWRQRRWPHHQGQIIFFPRWRAHQAGFLRAGALCSVYGFSGGFNQAFPRNQPARPKPITTSGTMRVPSTAIPIFLTALPATFGLGFRYITTRNYPAPRDRSGLQYRDLHPQRPLFLPEISESES